MSARGLLVAALGLALLACGRGAAGPGACRAPRGPEPEGASPWTWTQEAEAIVLRGPDGWRGTVPRGARRIVSTLPGLTELVAALGGTDRLVGVSPHCDRPAAVRGLPRVGVLPVDHEALAALEPDLVLADPVLQASSLGELARHAPVLPLDTRSLARLDASIALLAEVLADPPAAAAATRLRADLASAREAAGRDPARPAPQVLLLAEADPPYVLGPGTLLDDLLAACGATNAACDLGRPSGPFAEEILLARRPDWILLLGGGALPEGVRVRWRDVPAVAQGRVASAAADDLRRAGPRTAAGLRRLADVLAGRRPPSELAEEDR